MILVPSYYKTAPKPVSALKAEEFAGFAHILKNNPNHDEKGRFTSKEKAAYHADNLLSNLGALSDLMASSPMSHGTDKVLSSPEAKKLILALANEHEKNTQHSKDAGVPSHPLGLKNYFTEDEAAAVGAKIKATMASKLAWKKIYQKKSLEATQTSIPEAVKAAMEAEPGSKAKEKLNKKVQALIALHTKQHADNGGDPEEFQQALIKGLKTIPKVVDHGALPNLLDAPGLSTAPPKAKAKPKAKEAPDAPPTWPNAPSLNQGQAKDLNHTLGVHFYDKKITLGIDHPDTKAAYAEWQKSKDFIAAAGFPHDKFEAAGKAKQQAQDAINLKGAKAKFEAAKKQKVLDDLADYAYQDAYHTLKKSSSQDKAVAEGHLQNSKLIALGDGHSSAEINKMLSAAKAKAKATIAAEKATFKASKASGGEIDPYKYHDKTTFESLPKNKNGTDAYSVNARKIANSLNTTEMDALLAYTGHHFEAINKALGQGKPLTGKGKTLHEVMERQRLPQDSKLYRNMAQKFFWDSFGIKESDMHNVSDEEMQKLVGRSYTEKVFSSTSKDVYMTSAFGDEAHKTGKMRLNIRAPKGSKAMDVAPVAQSGDGESEVVLQAGATYVIRAIKKGAQHGTKGYGHGGFHYELEVDLVGFR